MSYQLGRYLLFCLNLLSSTFKKSRLMGSASFVLLLMLLGNQAYAAAFTADYTVTRKAPTESTTNADSVVFQIDYLLGVKVFDLATTDVAFIINDGNATVQSIVSSLDSNQYFVTIQTGTDSSLSIRLNPTKTDNAGNTYSLFPTVVSEIYSIDKTAPSTPFLTVSPLIGTDSTPLISGTADPGSNVTVNSVGVQGCSVAVPATGIWSCEVNPALPFGVNPLNVQANDLAGNASPVITVVMTIINPTGDDDQDTIINEDERPFDEDTDRDGIPNYQDSDDDGDAIPTITEVPTDTDNDGIPDYLESNIIDTDGDGNFDFNDTDDDDDGKPTSTEILTTPRLAFIDVDADAIPDHLDKDETNVANTADSSGDSDGNGISDLVECPNIAGKPCPDLDHDGTPDYMDTDNDGDSLTDISEIGSDPANPTDTDSDTVPDYYEPNHRDTDGDGQRNHEDADDDGDNLPTQSENPIYNDVDGDLIPDYLDPDTNASSPAGNRDGDADNDGILDRLECTTGTICPDSDNDAIPDYMDAASLASTPTTGGAGGGATTNGVDTALSGGGGSFNIFMLLFMGVMAVLKRLPKVFLFAAKKQAIFFLSLSLILFNQQVNAASTLDRQWYVGGAIGQSKLSPDGHGVWDVTDDKDIGKKIYAGVDLTQSIGVEAFWNDFGSASIANGAAQDDIKYRAYGANVIYHAPVYLNQLHPFGKLGIAKVDTKSGGTAPVNQLNDYSVFAGLGAEYGINSNLTLRGEYEYFDKDIKQLSMGLNWAPKGRAQYYEYNRPKAASIPAALPNTIVRQPVAQPRPQLRPQPRPQYQPPRPAIKQSVTQYKTLNRTLSGGSNFATGSAQLTALGVSQLSSLARDITQSRIQIHSIRVVGHTDNVGDDYSNQHLSEQRANTVANFLASQGINRQTMRTVGLGEKQPILSNTTEQGKARNRRVEIFVQGTETVTMMN